MTGRIIICCLLFSLSAAGQELGLPSPQDQDSTISPQKSTPAIVEKLHRVQQFLDTRAKKKVDPRYIEVPDKPWRVIARYKENAVDVDYDSYIEFPETNEYADWQLSVEPPTAASVGLWVGYRGTGLSFSKSLTKNAGRYFSISSAGAKYGFNFRLRRFNTDDVSFHSKTYTDGNLTEVFDKTLNMPSPVWVRSVYINGYYVFNGRRYSQSAAYNQAVIQRRSAGSFIAGATWYQSSFDMSDNNNITFMLLSHNVGKIKVHQANIGLGYGYNFVPCRGLVINALAMPTLSVYNRVKTYKYDFNYCLPLGDAVADDFGKWDKETRRWENGATHRPMPLTDDEEGNYVLEQFDWWETEAETAYSAFRVNLDLRIGIAYNWRDYFIGIQGQYNNFKYKKDKAKVNIFDAYARLSLGIRL